MGMLTVPLNPVRSSDDYRGVADIGRRARYPMDEFYDSLKTNGISHPGVWLQPRHIL